MKKVLKFWVPCRRISHDRRKTITGTLAKLSITISNEKHINRINSPSITHKQYILTRTKMTLNKFY